MNESFPKIENLNSMNERETISFLKRNGSKPLSLRDWQSGQPILFVFKDFMDTSGDTPTGPRPSIARVDSPISMRFQEGSESVILLENHGGQVDYFAIDARNEKIIYVRSSASMRDASHPYLVMAGNIFKSSDKLFPKRPGVVKT